jgi:hypothetical protein
MDDLWILVSNVFIDDFLFVFGKEFLNIAHCLLALSFIHHLPNYQLKLKNLQSIINHHYLSHINHDHHMNTHSLTTSLSRRRMNWRQRGLFLHQVNYPLFHHSTQCRKYLIH